MKLIELLEEADRKSLMRKQVEKMLIEQKGMSPVEARRKVNRVFSKQEKGCGCSQR